MSQQSKGKMTNAVAWFEIPAKKLGRAKKFYESILDLEMIDVDLGEDFKMTLFPVEEGGIGGALCEHKEAYKPSRDGSLLYINANPDLQVVLDKVEKNGGKILQQKTKITEEYGFMAVLQDTEGNRVALHSER